MHATSIAVYTSMFLIYVALIATLAVMTFRKGRIVLGIVGFIFPPLWLVGALMPPRQGSGHSAGHGGAQHHKTEGTRGRHY